MRNSPLEQQTLLFFLKCDQRLHTFEEKQRSVQDGIGDDFCPTCPNEKCVYLSINNSSSFYDYKKCKACSHLTNIPFTEQEPNITLFGGDGTHSFAKKTNCNYEEEKPSPSPKNFIRQSQSRTKEPIPKKAKIIPFLA